MRVDYHQHYSNSLQREMSFKHYGHAGQAMIVFPTSGGRFYQFEDFGMIDTVSEWLDRGLLQIFTIDGVDDEGWLSQDDWFKRLEIIRAYEHYVIAEFVPTVRHLSNRSDSLIAAGCSMGGFHAVNFALKHPDVFRKVLALSGIYDAHFFFPDFQGDETLYFNSPTDYLFQLEDPWFLGQLRQNEFIIAVGQGAFEAECVADTRKLEEAFQLKQLPAWFDYWGMDVAHDWEWWQKQVTYFLPHLVES